MNEDPRIAALTRQVMATINACTPGTRLAEVPTLFAFGPIYDAIAKAEQRGRAEWEAQVAALTAQLSTQFAAGTCLQCGTPNAKGGIVADDDHSRVLACHDCCEKMADFYGRARAIKRAEAAEAQVEALTAQVQQLRSEIDTLKSAKTLDRNGTSGDADSEPSAPVDTKG